MATQAEYTVVANALVRLIETSIAQLNSFEQGMIREYLTPDKINQGAGTAAETAVDTLDAYRALEKSGAIK